MWVLFNVLLISLVGILIYILLKKEIQKNQTDDSQKFLELQKNLLENFNLLKEDLSKHLEISFNQQSKIVETSAKIEEIVRAFEKNTLEIKNFKEILSGPKTRGYLGEVLLEEILKNLPSNYYEKQFNLGGYRVDYVLKINSTLIPIDAKFPIQNYQKIFESEEKEKQILKRDLIKNLKFKIEEISRKYILPSKGTVEYALMYLANEGIYYELLSDKDYQEVWDFAREKSVFLTSPKTFELICSYLLLIIRNQEASQNIKIILNNLHQLEKDLLSLSEYFTKAYTQLRQSFNNLQEFERILNRFMINFRNLVKNEEKLEAKIKEKTLI